MQHTILLAFGLTIFWLVNSGHNTTLMLSLGIISIAIVLYIAHRMDVIDHEAQPLHITLKLPWFFVWLTKEIILSNIVVVKHIWLGNTTISPSLARIKTKQKTDLGKVIYANSITLTPGTVSVAIEGDEFIVHGLLRESIQDLKSGKMDDRVAQLEN